MADNLIGLNTITLRGKPGDDKLLDRIQVVANAGFQCIGLWQADIDAWKRSGRSLAELRAILEDKNLHLAEICAATVCDEKGKVRNCAEQFRQAAMLNAACIICLYNNKEASIAQAREQWAEFLEPLSDFGVKAAFEFIGTWPRYSTFEEAIAVVEDNADHGAIVLDTFHFWRGRSKIETIQRVPTERICLVHLNDVGRVPWEKATDKDRTYPGEGVMPLHQILATLLREGYTGPFDVEIFGKCQEEDPKHVATKAYKTASRLVRGL